MNDAEWERWCRRSQVIWWSITALYVVLIAVALKVAS